MIERLGQIIDDAGYVGVAFLTMLETVFPPIPAEAVMPLAGFAAARDDMSLVGVIIAGLAGSLTGAVFWYFVGMRLGYRRVRRVVELHGHWLTLTVDELDKAQKWFSRRGAIAVLVGRMVPGLRSIISIPAGVCKIPMSSFLIFTVIGSAFWTTGLAVAGYWLESEYEQIADWLNPIAYAVAAIVVLAYLYRVIVRLR
jgi:membrane protein DedA with SNARE-associated domain